MTEKRDVRAKNLSGGQRRRLDLALALVGDPDLALALVGDPDLALALVGDPDLPWPWSATPT